MVDPWEVTWGPDDFLWVTEKSHKTAARVNPVDESRTVVLTVADAYAGDSQDGLLGMAFQPNFLKGSENNHVYLAYTYDVSPNGAVDRRVKIVRYTYDST